MTRQLKGFFLCIFLAAPPNVHAVEVNTLEISREGKVYRVHSDTFLNAPRVQVQALLAQYDRIPRLDPDISEVALLGVTADGSTRMRLASRQCVLLICFRYRWVQDVSTTKIGDILARFVAGGGNLTQGWMRYRTLASGDGTRLIVLAQLAAPDLPLPASLTGHFMRKKLLTEARETALLIERAVLEK